MPPKPINDTTFEVELFGKDKVEIGDRESTDFKPSIKLNRWDGECFIKVSLPTTEKPESVIEGNKVKFVGKDIEAVFYPLKPTTVIAKDKDGKDVEFTQNELGGFEFEVILKKKPTSNKIILDIETQELKFYYQPELTQEEIDEGCIRPDNAIGSYAVYHATKRDHIIGQTNYKCGKAFHIYRPKITDAQGKWVWGELSLDEQGGTLTTTISQDFLDSAVYPVSVDPNFGHETSGAGFKTLFTSSMPYACRFDGAPSSGTLVSITAWVGDGALAKWGIYKINGSNVLEDYTVEVTVLGSTTELAGNTTQSGSVELGADYWLALFGDENFSVRQDDGYEYGYGFESGETYPTWPDPYSPSISGSMYQFSIYCTYEVGGVNYPISTSTGLTASATIDRDVAYGRAPSAGLTASVSIVKGWGRAIATTANLTVSATVVKGWGRTITTSTALTIDAVISKQVAFVRDIIANLTTSVSVVKGWGRAIAITANLTIAVSIAKSFGKKIATIANLTISVSILKGWGRTITTSPGLTVAISLVKSWGRTITISTGLTISTTIDRVVAYNRTTQVGLSAAVSIARTVAWHRAVSAGLTISMIIVRIWGRVRIVTANLTVSVIVRYCVILRELLRVPISRLAATRLAISRMDISRVPISRKEIWRRIRSCFP